MELLIKIRSSCVLSLKARRTVRSLTMLVALDQNPATRKGGKDSTTLACFDSTHHDNCSTLSRGLWINITFVSEHLNAPFPINLHLRRNGGEYLLLITMFYFLNFPQVFSHSLIPCLALSFPLSPTLAFFFLPLSLSLENPINLSQWFWTKAMG